MTFLRIFKHLLPNARAWSITVDKKLRSFFEGLSATGEELKEFFDNVWLDIFPESTRDIAGWEQQFGLPDAGLTDEQKRERLSATWKALGGQDPDYIQSTLRDNGFDVYVHEWWEPGTEPAPGVKQCVTPRSPLTVLRREFTNVDILVECGEVTAECGEAFAEAGNSLSPRGYPLVNKILRTVPDIIPLCGEALAECGELEASCGNFLQFRTDPEPYTVPSDPTKWPYFLYIGGETFGDIAQVDPKRRDEFERLCLKICPAQQWLGILVEYI